MIAGEQRYEGVSTEVFVYCPVYEAVSYTSYCLSHLWWNSSLQFLLNKFPSDLCNVHSPCARHSLCRSFSLNTVMNRSISSGRGVLSIPGVEKWTKLHSLTSDTQQRAKWTLDFSSYFNTPSEGDKQWNEAGCVCGTIGASCCLTWPWWWIMNEQDRSSYHLETVSWWMITGSIGSVFA